MNPYNQDRASASPGTVRLSPHAELLRDRLAVEHAKLDGVAPEALDLAAAGLAVLHTRLNGRCHELRGEHTGDYRAMQIRGAKAMHVTDLCYLLVREPEAVVEMLGVILASVGRSVVATPAEAGGVHSENADLMRAVGEFEGALSDALADGRLTDTERERLLPLLRRLADEAADLEPAIRATTNV